jgi:hypothetical protein
MFATRFEFSNGYVASIAGSLNTLLTRGIIIITRTSYTTQFAICASNCASLPEEVDSNGKTDNRVATKAEEE